MTIHCLFCQKEIKEGEFINDSNNLFYSPFGVVHVNVQCHVVCQYKVVTEGLVKNKDMMSDEQRHTVMEECMKVITCLTEGVKVQ